MLYKIWACSVGRICRRYWPEVVDFAARDIHPTETSRRLRKSPALVLFVYFIFTVEWVLWAHSATK